MRIVYVIDSLASKGGAERILTDKMNYMATRWGYEVWVITCYQDTATMPNVYRLSESVRQMNLNIDYYSQYRLHYPRRLWAKWSLYRRTCHELSKAVLRIDPDVLVGLGYFMADVVSGIACRAKKIVESHEARLFTMSDQGLHRSFLSRCCMHLYRQRYFRAVERQADAVVTLTNGDAQAWQKARRVEVIPNFTLMQPAPTVHREQRVIAVGRLEWQKGFDRLIDVWHIVAGRHPGWRLDIFGSGTLQRQLEGQVQCLGLMQSVAIHPFTPHIAREYASSRVFVLTSRFEGFGLVLLEAMLHGLPCVVMDCPFGPSDVVEDGRSGYVVKDGDIESFASRLDEMMANEMLLDRLSEAAKERGTMYDADAVMACWKALLEDLTRHAS